MTTIDMRTIRYINLLDKISRVRTNKCFVHNNTIFFAVQGSEVSRAIGPRAENVKKIQEQIGIKVRIIKDASGIEKAKEFIEEIVSPVRVRSVETDEQEIIITAGNNQNKAILIGRNKRRYEELRRILRDFFHRELKII